MTQEDKNLLLKDLCARLPYGVIVYYNNGDVIEDREMGLGSVHDFMFDNVEVKPYLRPMLDMTEEEEKYINKEFDFYIKLPTWKGDITIINLRPYGIGSHLSTTVDNLKLTKIIDWLNAHHFDYRGLIEKGFAIAVTKENNPYKE